MVRSPTFVAAAASRTVEPPAITSATASRRPFCTGDGISSFTPGRRQVYRVDHLVADLGEFDNRLAERNAGGTGGQ